jgi:hypothetical protein
LRILEEESDDTVFSNGSKSEVSDAKKNLV